MKRQVKKTLKQLQPYFIEKGQILSESDYLSQRDAPVMGSTIKSVFGNYARMISTISEDQNFMALVARSELLQREKIQAEEKLKAAKAKAKPAVKAKPVPKFGTSKAEK